MTDAREDCTFQDWLDSWFYTDTADDEIAPGGKFRLYWCDLPAESSVAYLTRLFREGQTALAHYTNAQLNEGFWELIGASGALNSLDSDGISPDSAHACLESIVTLFREVFAVRCSTGLGHLDEAGGSPLNSICYMWWDVFPMALGFRGWTDRDTVLLHVLENQLTIDHDAVRESALHGLGHAAGGRENVEAIIDRFLARTPDLRPELRRYALNARAGCIQ